MMKDIEYFLMLDLKAASNQIKELATDRGNHHEVSGDAIQSLLLHAEKRQVTSIELATVLGQPDRIKKNAIGEVWEYHWVGMHGPNEYASSTPFQLTGGICRGLTKPWNR